MFTVIVHIRVCERLHEDVDVYTLIYVDTAYFARASAKI